MPVAHLSASVNVQTVHVKDAVYVFGHDSYSKSPYGPKTTLYHARQSDGTAIFDRPSLAVNCIEWNLYPFGLLTFL